MSPGRQQRAVVVVCATAALAVLTNSAVQWFAAAEYGWTGLDLRAESSLAKGDRDPRSFLVIVGVEPGSPGSAAGLRPGNRIEAVNGSYKALAERFGSLRPGEAARLTVAGDPSREVTLRPSSPFEQTPVVATIALNALVGIISLAIGAYVFARRRHDSPALILFVFTSLYALVRFTALGPIHRYGVDPQSNLIQLLVHAIAVCFSFAVLLHFCLIFPRVRPIAETQPGLLRRIYVVPAAAALTVSTLLVVFTVAAPAESHRLSVALSTLIDSWPRLARFEIPGLVVVLAMTGAVVFRSVREWRRDARLGSFVRTALASPARTPLAVACVLLFLSAATRAVEVSIWPQAPPRPAAPVMAGLAIAVLAAGWAAVMFVGYPIAACAAFWRSYRESGSDQKRQLRWPLLGLVLAIAGYLLTKPLLWAVVWVSRLPEDSAASLLLFHLRERLPEVALLLIPMSIAFAVLKYRLMDIDFYIRKTIIYGGLTGTLFLLYAAIAGGLGGLLTRAFAVQAEWFPIVTTLTIGVLFVPVRARVQGAVDKRFYRRRDYAAALARVTARLAGRGRADAVLQSVVDEIQEAIPARSASLWLASREGPFLEVRAMTGGIGLDAPVRVGSEAGLARAVESAGPAPWDQLAPEEAAALRRVGGEYVVPVRRDGRMLAFLTIGRKLSDAAWDEPDRTFLEAVAGQLAIALDESGPLRDHHEFERAREIQQALLPRVLPQPPGMSIAGAWQPARSVGGDYYDVIPLSEGRLGLAIADVAGKGVPAALLMSTVQATLKLIAPQMHSPAAICTELNKAMCRNPTPGKFVTFFYGVIQTTSRTIAYANAGHNAPVLMRADSQVVRLDAGGPPLGLFPAAEYLEADLPLFAGDRLVLYTDGVSDASSSQEEEFGEDGLVSVVRTTQHADAEGLKSAILAAVERHCGGVFSDDATLVVVAVREAPALSKY